MMVIKVLADAYIYAALLKFHSSKTIFVGATAHFVLPMPKSAWKSVESSVAQEQVTEMGTETLLVQALARPILYITAPSSFF